MSEAGDYDPGVWRDRDFGKSKRDYTDNTVGRSYSDAIKTEKKATNLVLKSLETKSESPLVVACDVTGSMKNWPATIFSKLPYLDIEGKEYLGKTMEISFAAIGDIYSDSYPLQVRPFSSGTDLEKQLKELVLEGNGGGQQKESYDLCMLYYARNVSMPKGKNPIYIMIGDEGFYDFVDNGKAKELANISLEKRLSTKEVVKELQKKFSVYLIRKPYDLNAGDQMSATDKMMYAQWESVLGADHISILPGPDRVVDVIFGILAQETERVKYFHEEIKGRQRPEQVDTVLNALKNIHKDIPDKGLNPEVKTAKPKQKRKPKKVE